MAREFIQAAPQLTNTLHNMHCNDEALDFDKFDIEEKGKLPADEVARLHNKVRNGNKYSLEETKTRNILMVGRTRSGKSTAVGVLKDPCFEPKEMSIFSDTVDPKFQSFSLDDTTKAVKYTVNVIDTPGLKEVRKMGEDARSDEVILNTINYCLKNEITKINILLIFISFELGVTQDDLNSFQTYLEKFGHDDIKIGICITRAEDKNQAWQEGIVSQLHQHAYFSSILKKENIKVCFIGCVDTVKNQTTTSIEDLQNLYVKVYRLREVLLKMIFDSDKQVLLVDLPIASGIKSSMQDLFNQQDELLNYLEGVTDYALAIVHQKVEAFAINIEQMALNNAILYDPEMNTLLTKMKARMKPLAAKMNESMRARFVGKMIL